MNIMDFKTTSIFILLLFWNIFPHPKQVSGNTLFIGFWLFLAFSLISWQLSSTCKYPNISFSFYDKVMKHTVYSDVFSRQEMMYKVYFALKKELLQ